MNDYEKYAGLLMKESGEKGRVRVTWLGTAGLYIEDDICGFYIDPYVSRHGLLSVFLGRSLPTRDDLVRTWIDETRGAEARAVFVSHSHFDHVLDAPCFAEKTGAVLVGSESTCWVGRSHGLSDDRMVRAEDGEIALGNFTISFIESLHGPALLGRVPYPGVIDGIIPLPSPARRYRLGNTYSLVIKHPAGTFVHHGSAGFVPGMYDDLQADVLFLGIAGAGDLKPYMEEVPVKLKAKRLVPIHFDNFFTPLEKGRVRFLPNGDTAKFWRHLDENEYGVTVSTLPLGQAVVIS